MLKHAADLSSSNEYFVVWLGDKSARPQGTKADAYSLFPEFELKREGMDFASADFTGAAPSTTETGVDFALALEDSAVENEFVGATIRRGSKTTSPGGHGTILSHTAVGVGVQFGTMTVAWSTAAAGATTTDPCYVVRETLGTRTRGYYPQVRVLTPWQPYNDDAAAAIATYPTTVAGGQRLTLPTGLGFKGSAAPTTGFEDFGVLLPATFHEGIAGWGVSDVASSQSTTPEVHTLTKGTGDTWDYTNPEGADDHLNGGYVIVDWNDDNDSIPKRSWAVIEDSTSSGFDVTSAAWFGDGDPSAALIGTLVITRWTAWVPHYEDSPFAFTPGDGFTYPNHDMQPYAASTIGPGVHSRPRGETGYGYTDTFGAMVVACSRLAAATGKRVNVINLGVDGATLAESRDRNGSGFSGDVGWWSAETGGSWAPHDSLGLWQRLDKLLRTVLPNAMAVDGNDGNAKPLKCLGIVLAHGESDAAGTNARKQYQRAQATFITQLRSLLDSLGYNPYENGAQIPYVQPRIAYLPNVTGADTLNLVNTAIEENTSADEFAASCSVDDLPRDTSDSSTYSGMGEAELGARIGRALGGLIDHGLGFGSTALATTATRLVEVANLALTHVGDAGQITSLTDGSEQASLCRKLLPEARDELLQLRQWGFALRRRRLIQIRPPEPSLYDQFEYCYVVPGDALNSFKVLPGEQLGDSDFDYEDVTDAAYATTFAAQQGSVNDDSIDGATPQALPDGMVVTPDDLLPLLRDFSYEPRAFHIEQSPNGHRYLFTNEPNATLQYVAHVVDASLYSPLFVSTLACNLASRLASIIIKGKEGEATSQRMMMKAAEYMKLAAYSESAQGQRTDQNRPFGFTPDHLSHRDGVGPGAPARSNYPYLSGFEVN